MRFDTLLVANRGEIACRILRTARALGLRTVAVYSDADRDARHVALADSAIRIGPADARASYLDIERIIAACRKAGAEAVHPGYGFRSESADFSRACRDAGIAFIGPSPEAIEALGNKSTAKALAQRCEVPVLPGHRSGADTAPRELAAAAQRIGAPLMIKAAAGGGGRGMRRVDDLADFEQLAHSAASEALAAFGSGELLLEQLLEPARHVEVQVFGDEHGNYIHLGERDCSTQRRHQKLIEEAPAPGVSHELREALGAAALRLTREVGYCGAVTIEFLLAPDGAFYFLEANPRLQVEHPVTEAVTGLDLVELQLRIAQGEVLSTILSEVSWAGSAIEARLCAEDPFDGFAPQSGAIAHWSFPQHLGVRIDHGLAPAATVPRHYDSLIAKLIATGADREQARLRLIAALNATTVLGIATNRDYLIRCLSEASFAAAALDTGWIERSSASWRAPEIASGWFAAAAALRVDNAARRHGAHGNFASTGPRTHTLHFRAGTALRAVAVTPENGRYRVVVAAPADVQAPAARLETVPNPVVHEVEIVSNEALVIDATRVHYVARLDAAGGFIDTLGSCARFDDLRGAAVGRSERTGSGKIIATMHAQVARIVVECGQRVARGELVATLESMKIEHHVLASIAGTISAIAVRVGVQVAPGQLLLQITADSVAGHIGTANAEERND